MEVADVTEPVTSPEPRRQVVKAMRNMWTAMYPVCYFHNFDFGELVNQDELIHGESLPGTLDLFHYDQTYSVRCGCKDITSHFDVLTSERMGNATALCKRAMRQGPYGHFFCSALQFRQW